jgi:glutaconate CoA-transferase subunit B
MSIAFSPREMMVALCAREIKDGETVFIGVGAPLLAGMVALRTHAPNMTLIFEAGGVGAASRRIPWTISDSPTTENALAAMEMWRVMGDTQRGYAQLGMLGGAQVDKFGNINTTVILGEDRDYQKPLVRLPGSGGANDVASSCGRTVLIMGLEKRRFVKKVDYITSPGYLTGGDTRVKAGLKGGGPAAVITDRAVFRFEQQTKEMYLDELFPGVTEDEVRKYVGWELKVSSNLRVAAPPSEVELGTMRQLDPLGIILGSKGIKQAESFDNYYSLMKKAYSEFQARVE